MGRTRMKSVCIWYLVWIFAISADALDTNQLNIWPMPVSASFGSGNLHLSNDFELKTDGSKFADASGILKEAFSRSLDIVRSTHAVELDTSKIDSSLVLNFSTSKEKKTYTVTFTATSMPSGTSSFAHLEWSDGKHTVGSPIVFSWT